MTLRFLTILTTILILCTCVVPARAFGIQHISFTSQAPQGNWSQPWQDACEEATIVMVDAFYRGITLNQELSRDYILHAVHTKEILRGKSLDESAQTITDIINAYYAWEARVVDNPTREEIMAEIGAHRPIIAPVYGRQLDNPYFTPPGPTYHTVLITGYEEKTNEFIVQEPGTRHGLDYHYPYDRLMSALHDYVPGDVIHGSKRMVFTSPHMDKTSTLDADNDGLGKLDEFKFGTARWNADTDGDGFTDGEEVKNGFDPLLPENKIGDGAVIRSDVTAKVYYIENGRKRHIISEEVFLAHFIRWSAVVKVSQTFLDSLIEGSQFE